MMTNSTHSVPPVVISPIEEVVSYPSFHFAEFNPRRRARGKEAARVMVRFSSDPEDYQLLWMSKQDVRNNIIEYGAEPALVQALGAYGL